MEKDKIILIHQDISQLLYEAEQKKKNEAKITKGTAYIKQVVKCETYNKVLNVINEYIK